MHSSTAPLQDFSNSLQTAQAAPEVALRPRVRIFNVKYSPNLGDGLLSECLEQALVDCGAHDDTWSADLAGRTAYGPGAAGRGTLIRALHMLPTLLRRHSVRLPLAVQSRRRWRPHYEASLQNADCVVIGGGNLIVDLDLNFPTKIALTIEAAERRGLPAFIYGCGVSTGWSRQGRALMRRALERGVVRKVFVRDQRSQALWDAEFGSELGLPASVAPDPGLLAHARYGLSPSAPAQADRHGPIGLNITSPVAVGYHSGRKVAKTALEAWYHQLAEELASEGYNVILFTNGSPEDRACATRLASALSAGPLSARISAIEPRNPQELARLVSRLQGLVAFRMHAIIAAYSCRIPFVALRWDPKLDSFVQSVDLANWMLDPFTASPAITLECMKEAIRRGIDPDDHARVIERARSGVADLYAEIAKTRTKPKS